MTGPAGDFLPTARERGRRARRLAAETRTRRWAVVGGALAAALLLVTVVVLASGGNDSPTTASPVTRSRRTTSTTKVPRTTTTTTTDPGSSTTSTTPGGAEVGPGPGSSTENTGTTPGDTSTPTDPSQGVRVAEDAGACRYNTDTGELEDAGTLTNPGSSEAVVEVEVTWSDGTGELDSWSDIESVPAGGSTPWNVSSSWPDPPQGLTCHPALI